MHQTFKERGMYQIVLDVPRETMIEMGFAVPPLPFKVKSARKMDKAEEERLVGIIGNGQFLEIKYPYETCTDPKRGTHTYPETGEWFTGIH
jgi:hypothetical protein